jgi:glycosyltransferase involved in cell wall biosynthesis
MTHTQPVRVLHLGSPAGLYGAERWILALVRHLDPKKISSVIGVIQDDFQPETPPLIREAQSLGIDTMVIRAPGRINLAAILKLRNYLKNREIDLVHTHWYKTDIIGWLATRGIRCKIVSTPHGWSKNAGPALLFYEWLDRLVFLFLDAVVPLSAELYEGLKKIPFLEKKLTLIPNGVDLTEIQSCRNIHPQLVQWKNQGIFIMGYIGQIIHRKGLDVLFNALSKLDQNFAWKLAVVGDGPDRPYLETLAEHLGISKNVNFFGFQDHRIDFLNGFDVFVLPSRLEGIPRCLMEALAAEKPVISSDIPGSMELIKDGLTGLLFKSEAPAHLLQKIVSVFTQYAGAKKMAATGKHMVCKDYSAARMAMAYEKLYDQVL